MNKRDSEYCRDCIYSELFYYFSRYERCCMYLCVTGEMRKSKPGYGCTDKKTGKRIKQYANGTPRGRYVYYKDRVRVL